MCLFVKTKKNESLIIQGFEKDVNELAEALESIDRTQPSRILVKVRVLSLTDADVLKLGIQYNIISSENESSTSVIAALSSYLSNGMLGGSGYVSHNIGGGDSTAMMSAVFDFLNLRGVSKTVEEPVVEVLSGETSLLSSGLDIRIQKGIDRYSNISYGDLHTGLTLQVSPTIIAGSKIFMDINVNTKTIEKYDINRQPVVAKKEMLTKTMVNNGEMIVLGSLTREVHVKINSDIPYLSKIPWIGEIFKHTDDKHESYTLVIAMVPYIVGTDTSELGKFVYNQMVKRDAFFDELNKKFPGEKHDDDDNNTSFTIPVRNDEDDF